MDFKYFFYKDQNLTEPYLQGRVHYLNQDKIKFQIEP